MISKFFKGFAVSRTIQWGTLVTAAYLIFTALGMDTSPEDANVIIATVKEMFTSADGLIVLANNLVIIVLRWITKKPIEDKL